MGVDYEICDHCHYTFADCGDNYTFEIIDYGDYQTCGSCMIQVKKMLIPEELPKYFYLVKGKGGERLIFKNQEDLKEWYHQVVNMNEVKDEEGASKIDNYKLEKEKETSTRKQPKYQFAIYKREEFPLSLQLSWQQDEKSNYGGLIDMTQIEKSLPKRDETYNCYIAWHGVPIAKATGNPNINSDEKERYRYAFDDIKYYKYFHAESVAALVIDVRYFILKNKLQNIPFLTTLKLKEKDEELSDSDLNFWAKPEDDDKSRISKWCDTLEALLKMSKNVFKLEDIGSWKAKPEFIQNVLESVDTKMDELKTKKRKLEKMKGSE